MARCIHAYVTGRVQGVFFRASAADRARELGVNGWIRNLADGRVEVLAAGRDEALDAFVQWLHDGPPQARIDDVQVEDAPAADVPDGFTIR